MRSARGRRDGGGGGRRAFVGKASGLCWFKIRLSYGKSLDQGGGKGRQKLLFTLGTFTDLSQLSPASSEWDLSGL